MTDEVENTDAPEPIETEAADAVEEVEEEQRGDEPSESSTETDEAEPEKKADPVQSRIDELTRLRRQAERDAEYWRQQAMQQQKPEPKEETEQEPIKTLEDFDYDEAKYQQHLFDRARAEAVAEAKRVLAEEQNQQVSSRKVSSFRAKEADFSKDVEDYIDVVQNPNLSISQAMADVAMEMDNGPEVLYYLGKNPDLADEIARLSPLSAARELGRIEASLSKPSADKVSKAPAPTPKLKGAQAKINVSADTPDSDKLSTEEWMKKRMKQVIK